MAVNAPEGISCGKAYALPSWSDSTARPPLPRLLAIDATFVIQSWPGFSVAPIPAADKVGGEALSEVDPPPSAEWYGLGLLLYMPAASAAAASYAMLPPPAAALV